MDHLGKSNNGNRRPATASQGAKPGMKGGVYNDVKKLQLLAKKAIDGNKSQQAKNMIEKALKQYGHQDAILHFQCGVANVNLGYLLAGE